MNALAKSNLANAGKWMQQGLIAAGKGRRLFIDTKIAMLDAGWFFRQAQQDVPEGEFGNFLAQYSDKIGRTTVYRYIERLEEALADAAADRPDLKSNPVKLLQHAKEMTVLSPKKMIGVWRAEVDEHGQPLMRKFGEYDSVKYATKKLAGGSQIEFDFEKVIGTLEVLSAPDKYTFIFPEGRDKKEVIAEARALIANASKTLDELEGEVIEA